MAFSRFPRFTEMYRKSLINNDKILAVAPMIDWTDRHCRYFHRLLTKKALLYTEMVVDQALLHGDVARLLAYSSCEHPVALQLAGSDPAQLAQAAEIGAAWGYDEINFNVGCPSDRVQSGEFGACLMRQPELVGACIGAISAAVEIPVTVKCRIGVDDQDPEPALDKLGDAVFDAGCDAIWVHARKAWLEGLSPRQNREIPPLDYQRVYRLKQRYPDSFIGINGGIASFGEISSHLQYTDGVMLGRAAYHSPELLRQLDQQVLMSPQIDHSTLMGEMMRYTASHLASGGRVNHVTRHMLGLFQGVPGARRFRQIMTMDASRPGADESVIERGFAAVLEQNITPSIGPAFAATSHGGLE